MGRSRKPLIVYAIRGFESHPLRHSAAAAGRSPLRHMLQGRKEREEDIPAEQSASQEEARFPSADEDQARSRDPVAPPPQGPQAADGLTLNRSGNPARTSGFERGDGRIRSSSDYRRAYRRGRRLHGEFAVFHVLRNDGDHARLGLTAGRRVGGAVARNRLRRRVREHYRQVVARERLPAVDVVVHLKPTAAAANRRAFYRELDRLFETVVRKNGAGGRSRDRGRSRR